MRFIVCLTLLAGLTGCGAMARNTADRAEQRRAVVDAYLIAHGMARGYAAEPGAKRGVVVELMQLDAQAALAIHDMLRDADSDPAAASQQVASLAAVAAGAP